MRTVKSQLYTRIQQSAGLKYTKVNTYCGTTFTNITRHQSIPVFAVVKPHSWQKMRTVAAHAAWSVCVCVSVSVGHPCEPCKNGKIDRGAVWAWTQRRGTEENNTIQYNTIQYKICKAPCCRGFRGAGEQVS